MPTHSLIGKDLGNYVVGALLGEGGMGAVFEGRHRFLGDHVAIKVLHGSYSNNQQVSQRFFQEAKAARDIGHPSIIKVLDFGQTGDGMLYLVMELLQGQSLAKVVDAGPMEEAEAARIAAAIAEGLAVAHEKGVVHRDLKPDNIFIVGDQIKILDFGIAKVVSSMANTGSGALLGTPKYMAPEQARGAKHVGPHTDVYALGVILFQMVTGTLPFEGTEIAELLIKILMEAPPRPSSRVKVSPEMEALILACLEKDPAARPAGMEDLRNRLARWAGPPSTIPLRVSRTASTVVLQTSPISRPTTTLSESQGELGPATQSGMPADSKRRAVPWVIAGIAAVGAGAGVVGLFKHPAPSTTSALVAPAAAPASPTAPKETIITPLPTAERPAAAAAPDATVRTEPSGAQIFVDGKSLQLRTPKLLHLPTPYEVSFKLDGYEDAHEVINTGGAYLIKLTKKTARVSHPAPTKVVPPDPLLPVKSPLHSDD